MRLVIACAFAATTGTAIASMTVEQVAKSLDPKLTAELVALGGVVGKTRDTLRDPNSLEVEDAYTKVSTDRAIGCMTYRAKNGFGGFGQKAPAVWVLTVKNDKPVLFFAADKANEFNKYCQGSGYTDRTAQARELVKRLKK